MGFEWKTVETDVLIIGGGGAGMRAAMEVADAGKKVLIVTKGSLGKSGATITAAADIDIDSRSARELFGLPGDPSDSKDEFFRDIVVEGKYMNNQKLVEIHVDEAPERVREMVDWGVKIKDFYRAPGHRFPRGIWFDGPNLVYAMLRQVRRRQIDVIEDSMVVDLLWDNEGVYGAAILDMARGELISVLASAVILATGGGMSIYELTTAPDGLNGDGFSLAYRAGAELVDMEFPMFILGAVHPPALRGLTYPYELSCHLSGHLYNRRGERFLQKWDPRLEKTTRDILCRASAVEILEGRSGPHKGVFVSVKHLPEDLIDYFGQWFGEFHGKNKEKYQCFERTKFLPDPKKYAVEGAPACHFWNGGVKIDENCATNIDGLYASGEVTGGIHGANRISGNALTDILVWGARAGRHASKKVETKTRRRPNSSKLAEIEAYVKSPLQRESGESAVRLRKMLQIKNYEVLGAARDCRCMEDLLSEVQQMEIEALPRLSCTNKTPRMNLELSEAISLRGICEVIKMVATAAIARTETRGSHFRTDFPDKNDEEWLKNIIISRGSRIPEYHTSPLVVTKLQPEIEFDG